MELTFPEWADRRAQLYEEILVALDLLSSGRVRANPETGATVGAEQRKVLRDAVEWAGRAQLYAPGEVIKNLREALVAADRFVATSDTVAVRTALQASVGALLESMRYDLGIRA